MECIEDKWVERLAVEVIRQDYRFQTVYGICRDNNILPFGLANPFEMTPFQARLLDMIRLYDIVYNLDEEPPDEVLDDFYQLSKWYKNYRKELKKNRGKTSKSDNPYDNHQYVYCEDWLRE